MEFWGWLVIWWSKARTHFEIKMINETKIIVEEKLLWNDCWKVNKQNLIELSSVFITLLKDEDISLGLPEDIRSLY